MRDARLHDARYTAATILLELKVPLPAVMELMGCIAMRYLYTNEELATVIAGGWRHTWDQDDSDEGEDDGPAGALVPA